ncbi:MAG TPA: hypothetical protein VJN70_21535 [Gemmatimonadaceae bacterium]|nr:hypothetical protein [Gemmatimonadaceae bacterium]
MTEPRAVVSFRIVLHPSHNFAIVTALLAQFLFWAAVFVCLVAHIVIVRSVVRASPRRFTELAWAVVPAIALAVVLVMTWRTLHVNV